MSTSTTTTDEHDRLRAALVNLSATQAIAAEAIATGATHGEAAELAGVTRETVSRWVNHHPGFGEALDRARHVLADEAITTACRIRAKALAAVERRLDTDPDDLPVALAVLRAVPAPELGPLRVAGARLFTETGRLAANLPPAPVPRFADGRVNFLTLADPDYPAEIRERTDRIVIPLLAADAGVSED